MESYILASVNNNNEIKILTFLVVELLQAMTCQALTLYSDLLKSQNLELK